MNTDFSLHTISGNAPLRDALKKINSLSGGNMTLFVVDGASDKLAGTLTDGDIRRFLIAGGNLDSLTLEATNKNCMSVRNEHKDEIFDIVRSAKKKGIKMIPVVDNEGCLTDIIDLQKVKNVIPVDAVMMAGGKGERLRPLTESTPKPLLPIGGKPIIDYNVEELLANGVEHIFVTVNYLKQQLIDHFADSDKVSCVAEPCRLGTLGSLALIDSFSKDTVLVMNSDLLTSLDFAEMYRHHRDCNASLTMAVIPYTVSVPFAVVDTDGDNVRGLIEKPTYNYFANAGVYILQRELVEKIPKGEYLDAPDFVKLLLEEGKKVSYFPVNGTWIDIGSPDDYRNANKMVFK